MIKFNLKSKVRKRILEYFDNNSIEYQFWDEKSKRMIFDESSDSIRLWAEIPEVIGKCIEIRILFKDERLQVQSYYCENEGDILNLYSIRYELLEKYFYESMDHVLNFGLHQVVDQIFEVCGVRGEFLEYAKTQNYRKLPVWYGPDKDARRIAEVLCLIGMAWRKYSDMRFVQMLFKVCCTEKIFDIDDGVLVELLEKNLQGEW